MQHLAYNPRSLMGQFDLILQPTNKTSTFTKVLLTSHSNPALVQNYPRLTSCFGSLNIYSWCIWQYRACWDLLLVVGKAFTRFDTLVSSTEWLNSSSLLHIFSLLLLYLCNRAFIASVADKHSICRQWSKLGPWLYKIHNYHGRTVLVNLGYHSYTSFLQQ